MDRSGSSRRGDMRARYWAFLFDNLRRAVDEIYATCETDESVVECKVRTFGEGVYEITWHLTLSDPFNLIYVVVNKIGLK